MKEQNSIEFNLIFSTKRGVERKIHVVFTVESINENKVLILTNKNKTKNIVSNWIKVLNYFDEKINKSKKEELNSFLKESGFFDENRNLDNHYLRNIKPSFTCVNDKFINLVAIPEKQ